MDYLYGDSTPSTLKSNFLEFFRDALDFSVFVLQSDERIAEGHRRIQALRQEADAEMERLDVFVSTVTRAIGEAPKGGSGSPTAECAAQLTAQCAEALRGALNAVRGGLASRIAQEEAKEAAERAACTQALGALLAPHDPPDATSVTRIELGAGGYSGTAVGSAEFGLRWSAELAVPEGHIFNAPVRVERFDPSMEIRTPQLSGWISKEVKSRPQRIEKHIVTEFGEGGGKITVKLRAEGAVEMGFDLEVELASKRVTIERVGPKDDASVGEFEVQAEDAPKLIGLAEKLHASARELKYHRLVEANIDEVAFQAQPSFTTFVERMVAMMAPIARMIGEHSLTPNELVIRRLLGNDRREEIFVAKSTLRDKFAPLSPAQRALFAPLALDHTPQNSLAPQYSQAPQPPQASQAPQPPPQASQAPRASQASQAPPKAPSVAPVAIRSELPPSQPPPPPVVAEVVVAEATTTPMEVLPPPRLPSDMGSDMSASPPINMMPDRASALPGEGGPKSVPPGVVTTLKAIVGLAKKGNTEQAYKQYAELFESTAFAECRPEAQRQALRLMVLAKVAPTDAVLAAHRSAIVRTQALIDLQNDPADYELLGVSQMVLADTAAASATFATALSIERERNPQSELCGSLMRRASSL